MPKTADEASAMACVGIAWRKANAPERLRPNAEAQFNAGLDADERKTT